MLIEIVITVYGGTQFYCLIESISTFNTMRLLNLCFNILLTKDCFVFSLFFLSLYLIFMFYFEINFIVIVDVLFNLK